MGSLDFLKDQKEFGAWGIGVHKNIPDEEYFKIRAVSSTSLKYAKRSMKHFENFILNGNSSDTPSKKVGRLVHLALFQKKVFDESVVYSDIPKKTLKAYKDLVKKHKDKIVLSSKEVSEITGIIQAILDDPAAMQMIQDGIPEVTILAVDPITKLNVKCKIDWLCQKDEGSYTLDYKTCEDAKPTEIPEPSEFEGYIKSSKFERNANKYGYENQGAFYRHVCDLAKIRIDFTSLLAQESEAPFVACPYVYEQETLDEANTENRELLNRINDHVVMGKFPGYTDKPVVIARPDYARTGK